MTVRVLVVDDSALMRVLIARKLDRESDIEVIGAAGNAAEARQLIKQLDPDVVTLDIEMPGMDGLSFLEKIMQLRPTPVIIVSSSTRAGTQATARALQLGAVNCYAKSTRERSIRDEDGGELARLVREAARAEMPAARRPAPAAPVPPPAAPRRDAAPGLIAIGSSTGGVEALHTLLAGFPEDCPPTLIVQHVSATFAAAIAQSLDRVAPPKVQLAESDLVLRRGTIVIAPGEDKHLAVAGAGTQGYRCVLRGGDPVAGHRPSVDRLFLSVAQLLGPSAVGVLLTGMGEDGARGLLAMADAGAHTIAQDRASCTVFGMPRAAIALGAARAILPLDAIAAEIFAAGTARSGPLAGAGVLR
jgi:two-component system chemotaxis response regulator CheB